MENKDLCMAKKIAERVAQKGGRSFFVGGYVRDELMGKHNKDIDIEVHGVTPQELGEILDSLGKRTEMGASFGIFGMRGYDLDIAMPRKEEATGRGHKDFEVFVDPFLGTWKAAQRRDFTMNALMQDVLTGEIIDHFGGIEDLKKGILRHVNSETFVEDPLRVLRGAQFAARFEYVMADETVELAKTMDLTALARERIFEELKKALLKAKRPSIFFEEMRKMEQLHDWFPEVEQLIGVQQDPKHHPEGDVWTHTMLVLDEAAKLRNQSSLPVGFMMTAITHDFGKVLTTEGLPMVKAFMKRISNEVKLEKYVLNMVQYHMKPLMLASQRSSKKATNRMFDQAISPEDLLLFSKADYQGRIDAVLPKEEETFLKERLEYFHETMEKPFVMGADLIREGLKPGPKFSEILEYAHKLRLANVEKERALKQTIAYARDAGYLESNQKE